MSSSEVLVGVDSGGIRVQVFKLIPEELKSSREFKLVFPEELKCKCKYC